MLKTGIYQTNNMQSWQTDSDKENFLHSLENFDRICDWIYDSTELNGELTLKIRNVNMLNKVLSHKLWILHLEHNLEWYKHNYSDDISGQKILTDELDVNKSDSNHTYFSELVKLFKKNKKIHLVLDN